jgi:hypothetical protein
MSFVLALSVFDAAVSVELMLRPFFDCWLLNGSLGLIVPLPSASPETPRLGSTAFGLAGVA